MKCTDLQKNENKSAIRSCIFVKPNFPLNFSQLSNGTVLFSFHGML